LGANGAGVSAIKAGNNITNANLDLQAKGAGGTRLTDGSGVIRLVVDNSLGVKMVPLAVSVPTVNGDLTVEATSNISLAFRFKGSDGVVRSAALVLA
jgi:hypothetical protein